MWWIRWLPDWSRDSRAIPIDPRTHRPQLRRVEGEGIEWSHRSWIRARNGGGRWIHPRQAALMPRHGWVRTWHGRGAGGADGSGHGGVGLQAGSGLQSLGTCALRRKTREEKRQPVRLAGSYRCWFVYMREKYCWLVRWNSVHMRRLASPASQRAQTGRTKGKGGGGIFLCLFL